MCTEASDQIQNQNQNQPKPKPNKNMARVHGAKLIAVLLLCSVVVTVITVLQNRSLILSRYKSANTNDVDNAKQRHVERQTSTPEGRQRTRNVSALRREGPVWPRTAQTRPLTCQNCFHFDFPILLENSSICRTGSGFDSVDVIMMIFTTHGETLRREAIRQTWASVTRQNTANTRHFFILGRSNSTKQMRKTEDEHARHGDLLMLDFVDSYANLTFKTMSGLRWILNRCGQARYFLKADDDTWVNVPGLMHVLKIHGRDLARAIGGHCHSKTRPVRNSKSRYFASFTAYPQKYYPTFCNGPTYVSSLGFARIVTSISPNVPFFHLEDVYLSLCVQQLGEPYSMKDLPGFQVRLNDVCSTKSLSCVSVHGVSLVRLRFIWQRKCHRLD